MRRKTDKPMSSILESWSLRAMLVEAVLDLSTLLLPVSVPEVVVLLPEVPPAAVVGVGEPTARRGFVA